MHKITRVRVLADYRIDLSFSDGAQGVADLSDLAGRGVFTLWNDYAEFRKAAIGDAGELVWSDAIDLCPDALYMKAIHGAKAKNDKIKKILEKPTTNATDYGLSFSLLLDENSTSARIGSGTSPAIVEADGSVTVYASVDNRFEITSSAAANNETTSTDTAQASAGSA